MLENKAPSLSGEGGFPFTHESKWKDGRGYCNKSLVNVSYETTNQYPITTCFKTIWL